jgi:molecular chaperone DnaK
MEESKDKLSDSDRAAVSAAIEKVNQAKGQDDAAAINRALDELQRVSQAMAEHLYSSGQPGAGAGQGPPPDAGGPPPGADGAGPKPEDVIDVEFEEKK